MEVLQYVKTCFQIYFDFFKKRKNTFIKKSVEQLKKRYNKVSYIRKFFKHV